MKRLAALQLRGFRRNMRVRVAGGSLDAILSVEHGTRLSSIQRNSGESNNSGEKSDGKSVLMASMSCKCSYMQPKCQTTGVNYTVLYDHSLLQSYSA